MTINTAHIFGSPKTTLLGLAVLLVAASHGIHFDAAGHLAMTASDWFTVAGGALASAMGSFSQDADKQTAHVPGEDEPKDVDAHAQPNDPANTPVSAS